MEAWQGRWWGKRLDTLELAVLSKGMLCSVINVQVHVPRLQAGGREHCAKQKAFGTVFATATSPAILLGAEQSPCIYGGLFRRLDPTRERRGGSGVLLTFQLKSCFLQAIPEERHQQKVTRPPRRA